MAARGRAERVIRGGLFRLSFLAVLGSVLAGCAVQRVPGAAAPMSLSATPITALPGFASDDVAQGTAAFAASCARLLTLPADQHLGGSGLAAARGGKAGEWFAACTAARALPPNDEVAARAFLLRYFDAYRVGSGGSARVLFTGYFEPEVAGSLRRTAYYDVPLYARPTDLVQADLSDFAADLKGHLIAGRVRDGRLVPYYTRAEIHAGALDGEHLELIWLADPVSAFVLQIQGSGRVVLPDGRVVRVGYAGKNGRPYQPIGRILEERGAIPKGQVTLQSIEAWLRAHPNEAPSVMDEDPSFVFFRIIHDLSPHEGAPGALGVPLAPRRALAVDESAIPLGAPVWIAAPSPLGDKAQRLDRLMVAEDVGGAIKTPLRADIFFGWGAAAKEEAGRMNADGAAYLLLPKSASLPAAKPGS